MKWCHALLPLFVLARSMLFVSGQEGFLLMAEAVVRHGDKVPDAVDPLTADEWARFGIAGQLTSLGIEQMRNLGKVFNELYIADEPLLPLTFDQNLLYVRATSLGTARALVSAEAMMSTMYPGEPVPVYTVAAERETLLRPDTTCASYVSEFPRIKDEVSALFQSNYSQLLNGISMFTGYEGSAFDLIWSTREKVEAEEAHGIEFHPFLQNSVELIEQLGEYAADQLYTPNGPNDPRGPIGGELAQELVQNALDTRSGGTNVKFNVYSAHGGTLQTLWRQLGLGSIPEIIGATFVLELRIDGGQHYVNGVWHEPGDDGVTYTRRVQPIFCPTLSARCLLDDFADYVMTRNSGDGCCFVGQGFFDVGCGDYLDAATARIPECRLYRTWCPAQSCGPGQVVDRATLQCVQISV